MPKKIEYIRDFKKSRFCPILVASLELFSRSTRNTYFVFCGKIWIFHRYFVTTRFFAIISSQDSYAQVREIANNAIETYPVIFENWRLLGPANLPCYGNVDVLFFARQCNFPFINKILGIFHSKKHVKRYCISRPALIMSLRYESKKERKKFSHLG